MTTSVNTRPSWVILLSLTLAGCGGQSVDTSYGRNSSRSVNGTGVLAGHFRDGGHEVRTAVRLTDELKDWAEVIVRFSPLSGPIPKDEAEWYGGWLDDQPGRRLVYVPHDYDATREYWTRALEALPKDAPPRLRERVEKARDDSGGWISRLPAHTKEAAPPDDWFAVETGQAPRVCQALSGPWAKGVDPAKAALTRHETLKVKAEQTLLTGDGKPLVMSWDRDDGSRVLVVAGGTFLLNLPLTEPARWPLARRTVDWAAGVDDTDPDEATAPKRVAFVEGTYVLGDRAAPPSVFSLLKVSPVGRVAAQLFALGLVACLARAPRLGRPRPEEPSGADRPVAHPEALGALLARTRQAREARSILDAYRRWRLGGKAVNGQDATGSRSP